MGVSPKIGRLPIYGGELTGMATLYMQHCSIDISVRSVPMAMHMPCHAILSF